MSWYGQPRDPAQQPFPPDRNSSAYSKSKILLPIIAAAWHKLCKKTGVEVKMLDMTHMDLAIFLWKGFNMRRTNPKLKFLGVGFSLLIGLSTSPAESSIEYDQFYETAFGFHVCDAGDAETRDWLYATAVFDGIEPKENLNPYDDTIPCYPSAVPDHCSFYSRSTSFYDVTPGAPDSHGKSYRNSSWTNGGHAYLLPNLMKNSGFKSVTVCKSGSDGICLDQVRLYANNQFGRVGHYIWTGWQWIDDNKPGAFKKLVLGNMMTCQNFTLSLVQ